MDFGRIQSRGGAPHAAGWGSCPTYCQQGAPSTLLFFLRRGSRAAAFAASSDARSFRERQRTQWAHDGTNGLEAQYVERANQYKAISNHSPHIYSLYILSLIN